MTREEQIVNYAKSFKWKGVESEELKETLRLAIIAGAVWADRNPKELSSPSEDLEEAARHSEMLTYPMPEDGDIEKVMKVQEARIFHDIGFKAGAEWMAKRLKK